MYIVPSKTLSIQVHVVQTQLVYLTTICGIKPSQADCKGAEIHCILILWPPVQFELHILLLTHVSWVDVLESIRRCSLTFLIRSQIAFMLTAYSL